MNTSIDDYEKEGYCLFRNLIARAIIEEILRDAKNIFFRQFVSKGYTKEDSLEQLDESEFNSCLYKLFEKDFENFSNCGKQAQHLISLHSLSLSENILGLVKSAGLRTPIISTRPVMFFNHPRLAKAKIYHTVDAHQDWRSMQGSLNSVVIWIPLVDINRDLGALELLPGSHLDGLRTDHIQNGFGMVSLTEEESNGKLVSAEVNIGDALLFSSFLIHQSGENISGIPRWSCHFRYNDLDEVTFIERKFAHPYIYKPSEELITPMFPMAETVKKTFHQ